ncbi:MAG: magnesium-translocating P-type ATPase [Verrucomicrobia bacterium]|nr:magnesium-translocating P-type ATPase [Verrucomicrobiota bacterium]
MGINQSNLSLDQLYAQLKSSPQGLTDAEATQRLETYGLNSLKPPSKGKGVSLFLSQFKSPLILLLIFAALMSAFVGGGSDAIIIFMIIFYSGVLSFFQERGALNAVEKLLQIVETKTTAIRDGKETEVPTQHIVPGDIVILRAGDLIPADAILIECNHFFTDEASLTGESLPVEKTADSKLFFGTMVSSGLGKALVYATGKKTEYSQITEHVRFRPPETAFEIGVRKFGYMLIQITTVFVIIIFAVNTYLKKPIIDSFLFAVAIAVGLTPQLLPAIISVNLSHGARRMAKKRVIIKRLASIENFGQMNVLCTDKTGTLTEGKVKLDRAVGFDGQNNQKVAYYSLLNAKLQSGYFNPLDKAIIEGISANIDEWIKIDEIPYDFIRKRLSVICRDGHNPILITKGALPQMMEVCDKVELADGAQVPIDSYKAQIESYYEEQSAKGFRTLAIAYGLTDVEKQLTLLGFLHFLDPIKPDIGAVIGNLQKKGVHLKIVTGDNRAVATFIAKSLGIIHTKCITGEDMENISDGALTHLATSHTVFAEIKPNQKERIILSLRKSGHVVGYMGDGINDVTAIHSADVGIAVDTGADAAKAAADIVLLEKDLNVLQDGIEEGRRTFINTLKYVYMATSANLGNMFSMGGVSLFLSYLPLLPKQVLLTNFFSDFPEMALASDNVDTERLQRPVKWEHKLILKFMLVFALLNSVADFLAFGVLLWVFKADTALFRSGWFVENVASAALIVLAIRTRKVFSHSRPSRLLLAAVLIVAFGVPFLAYTPLGPMFELVPLPLEFYGALSGIVAFYFLSVEITKRFFFKRH